VAVHGSPPELIAYVVPKRGSDDANPLQRLAAKTAQAPTATDAAPGIALPQLQRGGDFRRQSHRRFTADAVPLEPFAAMLGALSARAVDGAPAAKYRYPSAGSLYPVEVCVSVKPGGVDGLAAGWYRYDPRGHRLQPLATTVQPDSADFYSANGAVFDGSAFSLFLVGDVAKVQSVYGDRARDFCLLEAGYIGQLLMETCPDHDIGLCPMNDPGFACLDGALALHDGRVLLHALVGGRIETDWSLRWMAVDPADRRSFIEQLQDHLRERLPAYMVPAQFQMLETLPLSANGKVDRRLLPTPDSDGGSAAYRRPVTPLEQDVVALWQGLLSNARIGLDDNFFELGGNSLLAVQLLSGLRKLSAAELSIAELFAALTPAEQVALIERQSPVAGASETIPRVARDDATGPGAAATADLSDAAVDDLLARLLEDGEAASGKTDGQS
jgi:SagB-type dehydrogenase family enzyme